MSFPFTIKLNSKHFTASLQLHLSSHLKASKYLIILKCDAYSHTPYKSGAKQPGMTGQVKEEIITRMGELGCFVEDGCLVFLSSRYDRRVHSPGGRIPRLKGVYCKA